MDPVALYKCLLLLSLWKNTNSTQKQIQRQCLKTSSGSTVLLMKFGKLFQTPVPEHKVSIWRMALSRLLFAGDFRVVCDTASHRLEVWNYRQCERLQIQPGIYISHLPVCYQCLSCAPIVNTCSAMLSQQRNPCSDCKSANSAQLGGTPYHSSKLHPGLCSSMGMRPQTDTERQTDTQMRANTIHFALSTTRVKCN